MNSPTYPESVPVSPRRGHSATLSETTTHSEAGLVMETLPSHEAIRASQDVEAGYRLARKDIFAVCWLEKKDETWRYGRVFHEEAHFCQTKRCENINKLWQEAKREEKAGGPNLGHVHENLDKALRKHHKSLLLLHDLNKLQRPSKASWEKYADHVRRALGPARASFITDDSSDWAELSHVSRLRIMVLSILDHALGRKLLGRWKKGTEHTEEATEEIDQLRYHHFDDSWAAWITEFLLFVSVSAFFGIPVALQALHITNAVGTVIAYFAFILAFAVVARVVIRETAVALMATIAFASVFASLIGH